MGLVQEEESCLYILICMEVICHLHFLSVTDTFVILYVLAAAVSHPQNLVLYKCPKFSSL